MTTPRSTLVCLDSTPWYHLVSRCVRRSFLCGFDERTGKNYSYRKDWVVERIKQLAGVFAIDIAAYAVMSNHYHLVIRVDTDRCKKWSDYEVLNRWQRLFKLPNIVEQALTTNITKDCSTPLVIRPYISLYRSRLQNMSWFMRVLNESIARRANKEDEITGRFWDGRFKSQALLDEAAVLAAMVYVDLNPIRAGLSQTLEASGHTSIAERLAVLLREKESDPIKPVVQESNKNMNREACFSQLKQQPLMPFDPTRLQSTSIMFSFKEYVELVETTGRQIHPDKPGYIPPTVPALLQRLGLDTVAFVSCARYLLKAFSHAIGSPTRLKIVCKRQNLKYIVGMGAAKELFV